MSALGNEADAPTQTVPTQPVPTESVPTESVPTETYEAMLAERRALLAQRAEEQAAIHLAALTARLAAARSYVDDGQVDQAVTAFADLVSDSTRVLGPTHPNTIAARLGLGMACRTSGDDERALVLLESVVRYEEARLGAGHREMLTIWWQIGDILARAGRVEQARESLVATLRTARANLGPEDPLTREVQQLLDGLPKAR